VSDERQLLAIRASLVACLAQVDVLLDAEVEQTQAVCSHPREKRKDISSMGVKRWMCTDCGYVENGAEAEGGEQG